MKNVLIISGLALALSGCNLFQQKPTTSAIAKDRLMETMQDRNENGLTRIQRGTDQYGFILEVDAGDSDVEIVMLDETSDDFLHRNGLAENINIDDYIKKTELDKAVDYLIQAQTMAYSENWVKSLEYVERALLISPQSSQAYSIKGSVLLQLGKNEEAKKSWQTALSFDSTLSAIKAQLESME